MGKQTTPRQLKLIGACLAAAGLWAVLIGAGVLPVPGGRAGMRDPLWVAALIGVIVLLAGIALLIQGFGHADANAALPPGAPLWMRATQVLVGVALFASFAALGSYVAFAGDARSFSGGLPILGSANVSLARIMFGFGALICWLGAGAYAWRGARQLFPRGPAA